MWIKECQRCHRQFEAKGNRAAHCPDCKPLHVKELAAINKKKLYARQKYLENGAKKPVVSLAEQNKKALAAGMTYGQYVAKYGDVEK